MTGVPCILQLNQQLLFHPPAPPGQPSSPSSPRVPGSLAYQAASRAFRVLRVTETAFKSVSRLVLLEPAPSVNRRRALQQAAQCALTRAGPHDLNSQMLVSPWYSAGTTSTCWKWLAPACWQMQEVLVRMRAHAALSGRAAAAGYAPFWLLSPGQGQLQAPAASARLLHTAAGLLPGRTLLCADCLIWDPWTGRAPATATATL